MNVALVIDSLDLGGAERVVERLALGLQAAGDRPVVYCLKAPGAGAARLAATGILVRSLPPRRRDVLAPLRLAGWLLSDGVHVVHAHSSAALAAAFPAARALRIPAVHTRHGDLLGRPSVYRRIADRLAPFVDRTVLVAHSLRPCLPRGRAVQRAVVIRNGVDCQCVNRDAARQELEALCARPLTGPVLLSVGTVCAERDTLGLIAAFAQLAEDEPHATLVCVGGSRGPDYLEQVRAAARNAGVAERVILPGTHAAAWRLMAGADVFVLGSASEAAPLAVLEAMSQSVPIVATTVGDVGGRPDLPAEFAFLEHGRDALLVPPRDPNALAGAIRACLRDPAAARRRAEHARERYRARFTADRMVAQYRALYAALHPRAAVRPHSPRIVPDSPCVLMVGPATELVGGMNSVIETLLHGPLAMRASLDRFGLPPPTGGSCRARAPASRAAGLFRRLLAHSRALFDLGARIRRQRPHVVHIHTCSFTSFYRSVADLVVARWMRARVVLHIHGGSFAAFCDRAGPAGRAIIAWAARCAGAVVVLSHRAATLLRPYVGDARIEVVPNGVPVSPGPRPPSGAGHPCRFVFLGAVRRAKGLSELLDAASRLAREGVPFELRIAGPVDDEAREWLSRATMLGLERQVQFLGPVRGPGKQALLAECDCLVLPSHEEAMPMAILEAGAAGLAVIATRVGDVADVLGEGSEAAGPGGGAVAGRLVDPGDVGALSAAMRHYAAKPAERDAAGRALQARVAARFSIEATSAALAAVYGQVRAARGVATDTRVYEYLVRTTIYPLHERLRGRRTVEKLHALRRLMRHAPAELQRFVDQRLVETLQFARRNLPFFAEIELRDADSPAHAGARAALSRLPVLSKADVRRHSDELTWPDVPGGLVPASSGGTTGDTLHFHIDRIRQAQDLAARLFMQSLFGVLPGARRLHLWGSPIEARARWLRRVRDRVINERLVSAFDLSPRRLDAYLDVLAGWQPAVVYGYPSALAALAHHAIERARTLPPGPLRLVVLTGEEIYPQQREVIQAAFGAPVASEYGNREVGLIAHECPHGNLHVITPHVCVEILRGGEPAALGQTGEIVCTTLGTRGQPMIRYRVGDLGRLLEHGCTCGLPLPLLKLEGGKVSGLLRLPDGRLCHGAVSSYAVQGLPGIRAFRTHQRSRARIDVLVEADERFTSAAAETVRQRYRKLFGPAVQVECQVVERIPPDPSGKRRHVISDVVDQADAAALDHVSETVLGS